MYETTTTNIASFTTSSTAGTNGTWFVTTAGTTSEPWGGTAFEFTRDGQQFSFGEKFKGEEYIKVDKGSPTKARYAVFYAVKTDPVIFCRTRREMIKAVKGLLKRPEVDKKSIRIFGLMGGSKKAIAR